MIEYTDNDLKSKIFTIKRQSNCLGYLSTKHIHQVIVHFKRKAPLILKPISFEKINKYLFVGSSLQYTAYSGGRKLKYGIPKYWSSSLNNETYLTIFVAPFADKDYEVEVTYLPSLYEDGLIPSWAIKNSLYIDEFPKDMKDED